MIIHFYCTRQTDYNDHIRGVLVTAGVPGRDFIEFMDGADEDMWTIYLAITYSPN